jgi:hypothetical protein
MPMLQTMPAYLKVNMALEIEQKKKRKETTHTRQSNEEPMSQVHQSSHWLEQCCVPDTTVGRDRSFQLS